MRPSIAMAGSGKEDKKRKATDTQEEEAMSMDGTDLKDANEVADTSGGSPISDTASTQPSLASSAAGMNSDMTNTVMTLLLEAKTKGELTDQANKVWQFNSDKAAFDNKVALGW